MTWRKAAGVLVSLDSRDIAADGDGLAGQQLLAEFDDVVHRHPGEVSDLHQRAVHPDDPRGAIAGLPDRRVPRIHGVHNPRTRSPSASTARTASRGSEQSTTTWLDRATRPPPGATVIVASGPAASAAMVASRPISRW